MTYSCCNHLQAAILYAAADPIDLALLTSNFLKMEENAYGYRYNVIETDGKTHFRCFGGAGDVMVFVEVVNRPGDRAAFGSALGAVANQILTPDAQALIDGHRAMLLVNVSHGVLPDSPEIAALLSDLAMAPGQSPAAYIERLRVMGLLAWIATDISKPTLVHWTHSEALLKPQPAHDLMLDPGPNPLHVLPLPFRAEGTTQEDGVAGFVTWGASGLIGREIRMRPSTVSWYTAYEHALGFVRVALMKNGYVIPDGDTFGDEKRSFSYRVHHTAEPLEVNGRSIPCYELEPLLEATQAYRAPSYVPPERIVDIDRPQREYGDFDSRDGKRLVAEWREKRRQAAAAGIELEVRAVAVAEEPAPPRGLFGWISAKLRR